MKLPANTVDPLINRPVPVDDPSRNFFWTSGADGRLRILHCADCEYFVHPPSTPCPRCLSPRLEPRPVSGLGVVNSFTVNVQPWTPGQQPYVIAVVELAEQEGLRLTTNIVEASVESVRIGSSVAVAFIHRHDLWYPVFRIEEDS